MLAVSISIIAAVCFVCSECGRAAESGPVISRNETECAALVDLYNATEGFQWSQRSGWTHDRLGTDCCAFPVFGITCSAEGHITGLNLRWNKVTGALPESLGALIFLETL